MSSNRQKNLGLLVIAAVSFCAVAAGFVVALFSGFDFGSETSVSPDALILTPVPHDDTETFAAFPQFDRHIALVLGYGCNDAQTVSAVKDMISRKFGFAGDGGIVSLLVFPDDFMHAGKGQISRLAGILQEMDPDGLVIAGAPEYTHAVLSRLHDAAGTRTAYPVFNLFPQDDVLGIEAGSDIVFDYLAVSGGGASETDSETSVLELGAELPELLLNAVRYMTMLAAPLPLDSRLYAHAQQLVGPGWEVSRYIDSETGLVSLNHFVIEKNTDFAGDK